MVQFRRSRVGGIEGKWEPKRKGGKGSRKSQSWRPRGGLSVGKTGTLRGLLK